MPTTIYGVVNESTFVTVSRRVARPYSLSKSDVEISRVPSVISVPTLCTPGGRHAHQAAQDAHTHGSAEAYDPPIVWANRARPMPWEKADPDRVPEVGLLGKREGVLRG